jgi:hypothetical protein
MKTLFPLSVALACLALVLAVALLTGAGNSPAEATTPDRHGDATCDGSIELGDAIAIISESADVAPGAACGDRADVDCNGTIDPGDGLRILRWFVGAPLPHLVTCPEVGTTLP